MSFFLCNFWFKTGKSLFFLSDQVQTLHTGFSKPHEQRESLCKACLIHIDTYRYILLYLQNFKN